MSIRILGKIEILIQLILVNNKGAVGSHNYDFLQKTI
jgi:hypothetical protein